jgi:hypothetical protein
MFPNYLRPGEHSKDAHDRALQLSGAAFAPLERCSIEKTRFGGFVDSHMKTQGGQMKYFVIRILLIACVLGLSYRVTLADPIPSQNAETVAPAHKAIDAAGISEWESGARIDASSHGVATLNDDTTPSIPEPATALLVGISLLVAGTMGRRGRKTAV